MRISPFLFKYRVDITSKRVVDAELRYDDINDILLVKEEGRFIPAIDAKNKLSLGTTKADLEKGYDQKDP